VGGVEEKFLTLSTMGGKRVIEVKDCYVEIQKLNNKENTAQTQTLRSPTDFSLHTRSSPFAVSVQSAITNLHIFLFLSYSFLLVAG
jgi:hypothetical protein